MLLLAIATAAVLAGVVGRMLAEAGSVFLVEPLASRVPKDRHVDFLTDLWAHSAAYAAGFVGGLVLATLTWRRRGRAVAVADPA
jgi:p-aminobenzoyl-glutamate transporter AbgT